MTINFAPKTLLNNSNCTRVFNEGRISGEIEQNDMKKKNHTKNEQNMETWLNCNLECNCESNCLNFENMSQKFFDICCTEYCQPFSFNFFVKCLHLYSLLIQKTMKWNHLKFLFLQRKHSTLPFLIEHPKVALLSWHTTWRSGPQWTMLHIWELSTVEEWAWGKSGWPTLSNIAIFCSWIKNWMREEQKMNFKIFQGYSLWYLNQNTWYFPLIWSAFSIMINSWLFTHLLSFACCNVIHFHKTTAFPLLNLHQFSKTVDENNVYSWEEPNKFEGLLDTLCDNAKSTTISKWKKMIVISFFSGCKDIILDAHHPPVSYYY